MRDAVGKPAFDLITWGETMLRFSPPSGVSIESAPIMEVGVGGTESNVAVAMARLGKRVCWVSRLPENPLGRRVAAEIAAHGVDTSHVLWAPGERMGVNFIETASAPRANVVIYDRAGSALANLKPDELDYGLLASGAILHLTGITPALGPGCRAAWLESARRARAAGRTVALDINYRAKLWSPDQAQAALEEILPHVSVVLGALRDVQLLFGMPKDPEQAVQTFAAAYRLPLAVLTLGAEGALALSAQGPEAGQPLRHPAFPTGVVDRIGAGDAFAAGFLFGWQEKDVAHGLRCGTALAALKQTYRGDITWSTREDLLALVENEAGEPGGVKR